MERFLPGKDMAGSLHTVPVGRTDKPSFVEELALCLLGRVLTGQRKMCRLVTDISLRAGYISIQINWVWVQS